MNASEPNALARALRGFFADHLPRVRGSSPHTALSYRDSLVLLLRFVATQRKRSVSRLDLTDLGPAAVLDFLEDLERTRHNLVATRNVRLAAIHAFFRYCATTEPALVEHCQRVLAIPFKRSRTRPIEYFDYAEIEAVLGSVDRSTADGRRDYALLATMFNTGARVQEVVALCVRDLQLQALPQVRLYGKECHAYCISFHPRDETTGTHAGRQACDLASSAADVLPVVRRGIGVDPYTNALGASRVVPMSEPWAA